MYIQNAIYKSIPVGSLSLPVAAGTIVTINGNLATSADNTFGIVPETITSFPPTGKIRVAVSGAIDLDKCGVSFTDEQIKALGRDFNLIPAKEIPDPELPSYTTSDKKKFLKINSSGNGLEWGTELPTLSNGKFLKSGSSGVSWETIQQLPTVGAGDNGKVLVVVNGAWAVVEPDSPIYTPGE